MPLIRCLVGCLIFLAYTASAAPDLKFDVFTFGDPNSQAMFDHLNTPSTNGHYIAMGGDSHRYELATNGNALAIYYNTFNDGYSTNTGAQQAAMIDQYGTSLFTTLGPKPNWIVLNEISSSLWQNDSNYRPWVHDVVHALKNTYGYKVILYAPFANPNANSSDWQAVSSDAYIGIENYLSGELVKNNGFSVSYCQGQYQSSITSYTGLGVARAQLMLGELFGQTLSGTGYGRAGVSSNDWDTVISVRNRALLNIGFTGFLSYAWSGNDMGVTIDEMLEHEDVYATNRLPTNAPVTGPFVLIQPASQTIPSGGTANFIVFKAGTAPTTYQWQFKGTNIAGATTSTYSVTNIQVTDSGNYSVVLSNSAGSVTSSNGFLTVDVPPPLAYEPFTPAITPYNPGSNLIGQTNAAGQRWTQAGSVDPEPTIQSGSLAIGGLAGVSGNCAKFGGNGMSARFNIGSATTSGTLYFSFITRLADISTLNGSGVFWAGFNNSSGTTAGNPSLVATRVVTRGTNGGFNIGLDKNTGTATNFLFVTNVFSSNDTIFVVGSYTFNTGATNDDVSQMWINPPASAFGQANPPPANLTNAAGGDISQIASFVLCNRSANEPAVGYVDEIRVGTSWASVTPPAESAVTPTLSIAQSPSTSVLSWTTNAPGFLLEQNNSVVNPNSWSSVPGFVYIVGGNYTVTNSTSAGPTYYRLRQPQ